MFHIVDDTEVVGQLLTEIIELFGNSAQWFSSPTKYLAFVESPEFEKPTAVITDVHMPEMSGYKMMKMVLDIYPDINFAVISGEANIESKYKELACMYLVKPYEPQQIKLMIEKFSRCKNEGASVEIGCAEFGDRDFFRVGLCPCPKLECIR
ncbi:transcriptional regulatory protein FixJ [Mariprofundus micogutta]|uniref:Transcriptional regulatory protein FixJ n=1 Tax=Mariprofundus micogutta TaxID=1921010 RepID=A0A1L8CRM1_9PROT|nr:response regulator [Mariprofundus micogutta]GAV21469.1 transcriptional regulatory protein FixJ [Mariprofundus micogutta]